ncbi:MAG: hypothetical protein BJ554DRAFT_6625 [Olpidium bornovanus]|uniref:Uncharacterized protein n=1 Tax=Olpidium bornovanus TaxID=278681 RepID=A0A8H8DJU9_9FUNG|nr:MAG: hypothetical protein BJ554DRAFT_6625 [Olpidium bornovanus]
MLPPKPTVSRSVSPAAPSRNSSVGEQEAKAAAAAAARRARAAPGAPPAGSEDTSAEHAAAAGPKKAETRQHLPPTSEPFEPEAKSSASGKPRAGSLAAGSDAVPKQLRQAASTVTPVGEKIEEEEEEEEGEAEDEDGKRGAGRRRAPADSSFEMPGALPEDQSATFEQLPEKPDRRRSGSPPAVDLEAGNPQEADGIPTFEHRAAPPSDGMPLYGYQVAGSRSPGPRQHPAAFGSLDTLTSGFDHMRLNGAGVPLEPFQPRASPQRDGGGGASDAAPNPVTTGAPPGATTGAPPGTTGHFPVDRRKRFSVHHMRRPSNQRYDESGIPVVVPAGAGTEQRLTPQHSQPPPVSNLPSETEAGAGTAAPNRTAFDIQSICVGTGTPGKPGHGSGLLHGTYSRLGLLGFAGQAAAAGSMGARDRRESTDSLMVRGEGHPRHGYASERGELPAGLPYASATDDWDSGIRIRQSSQHQIQAGHQNSTKL